MQRIRTSLPYFSEFGWNAAVVTVDPQFSDTVKDELLVQSLPADLKIFYVKAFSKKYTAKFGLGSIALRSLWYYFKKVNQILKTQNYDLIYFSTTQFPVCTLGAYWKKRFKIPYVIDMQDPWHSDYYNNKSKSEQPPKYWFSYRLNKYLEPIALKKADGLISVSEHYISDLKNRYPEIKNIPSATITFGAFEYDLAITRKNHDQFKRLLQPGFTNIVYVGRGGQDLHRAITPVFKALKKGLIEEPVLFGKLRFYFIGTSYAPVGEGKLTIMPLAERLGVTPQVTEITDRISYYHTLATLQEADALFIPGSDDPKYTASKIYSYLLTKKPLLAVFNEASSTVIVLKESTSDATIVAFNEKSTQLTNQIYPILKQWANGDLKPVTLSKKFDSYSAKMLTGKQTELFKQALDHYAATDPNA